jgi:hypothetical protein
VIAKLLEWTISYDYTHEYLRSLMLENLPKTEVDKILPYDSVGWKNHETFTMDDEELKLSGLFEPYEQHQERT